MSYEKKLMQMKGLIKKNPEKEHLKKEIIRVELPPNVEMWKNEGLQVIQNEFGYLFVKESFFRKEHIHGNVALHKLEDAVSYMQKCYPNHPLTISSDRPYSFYDTETTGLIGSGVFIFLNGILQKVDGGLLLRQYILADPSQEAAFLFATDFWKESQTFITYNGKSFDLPQLQTRWTMNREWLPKLKEHDQIDLMHTSKRVWKGELDRFKLKQVEEQKLHFIRKDDVPGHLAPIIYFDAVKSGNPSNLMKVLKHNEWDILSLIALYIVTVDLLKEKEVVESSITYTNIGKWFQDLKINDDSFDWFQFVVINFPKEEASVAFYFIGLHLKRRNLFDESISAFHESLKEIDRKYRPEIYIELAKLYEHQKKDYISALEMTQKSAVCMESAHYISSPSKQIYLSQDIQKRKKRLNRKINISQATAQPNKKRILKP